MQASLKDVPAQRAAWRHGVEAGRLGRGARLAAAAASIAVACLVWERAGGGITLGTPLLERLQITHDIAAAALSTALLGAGVGIAGLALELLLAVEAVHKLVLGAMLAGPLGFAGATDPEASGARPGDGGQAATLQSGIQIGLYGGGNSTPPADVFYRRPNGTDMVLEDVPWTGEPFDDPPYYGVRVTFWTPAHPALGAMLDFTHAKSISLRHAEVDQRGTLDGKPVPPRGTVSQTFTKLEYSHGLNFLTLNAVYRFTGWRARILPYFGAGIGIMLPHTEIARTDIPRTEWTYRYELSGLGFQGLAGLDWRLSRLGRWSVFSEYKAGYAMNRTELLEGGRVETDLWAHQAILGISAMAWRP